VAGSPASFFLGLGAAAIPLTALSILTSDFRLRRILAFLFPAYEPHGQGYQILGSIKAIRSGGLIGKGFGLGSLKRGSIPEVQSDFIFAAWTEETGFLGVLAVIGIFGFLAWRAFKVAFGERLLSILPRHGDGLPAEHRGSRKRGGRRRRRARYGHGAAFLFGRRLLPSFHGDILRG
jgi:cell division protein FtsW (lipid II flippase)